MMYKLENKKSKAICMEDEAGMDVLRNANKLHLYTIVETFDDTPSEIVVPKEVLEFKPKKKIEPLND